MKRTNLVYIILIVTVLLIILSGCRKTKLGLKESTKDQIEPIEDLVEDPADKEQIMKDFNNIVESKNYPDKVALFIDENIDKLTDIEGDKMISQLEKVLEEFMEPTTDNILKLDTENELISIGGNELFFPEDRIEDIKNQPLRQEIIKAIDGKYKLINLEGSYYPIIDYEKLNKYAENISPELKDYISIKSMDSQKPVAIDAALYISYEELAERILKTEDYIQRYSEGQRYEEMLKAYKNKLTIYLSGMSNSPISDPETGKIHDNVLESYKNTANTKDQVTGFIVKKYLKDIEKADYIIYETMESNILSLINESLSLLEETK